MLYSWKFDSCLLFLYIRHHSTLSEIMGCAVIKITKATNKMQLYRLIYYSKSALHVSGDVFAHHQENLTVFRVSGSVHPSR
jgi:hypothetical protein